MAHNDVAGLRSVLIADDDPRVRAALRVFLGAHGQIDVVEEAATSGDALAIAQARRPAVAIVDLHLPGLDQGLALLQTLTGELGIPALAISLDVNAQQSALDAGAYMFIDKVSVSERLVDALALALR